MTQIQITWGSVCVFVWGGSGNARCNTTGIHVGVNECSFNTGNTYDLRCALSQVSFDKTFMSNHLEEYDTNSQKMIAGTNVKFFAEYN